MHAAAEALAQHPSHQRQTGPAADEIDPGDAGLRIELAHQRGHDLEGPLDQRRGRGVEVLDREDHGVVLLAEVDHHPTRLRQQTLLRRAALLAQRVHGRRPELLHGQPCPLQHQLEQHLVDVVAAETADAVAAEHGVPAAVGLHQ